MPTAARKPIEQPTPTPTDAAPMSSEVVAPAAPTETEASLTPTTDATLWVPTADIETLVVDALRELLRDPGRLTDAVTDVNAATAADGPAPTSIPDLAPVALRHRQRQGRA